MSTAKVTDPGCDGRCVSAADLGVPEYGGDLIAYLDPECTAHGPLCEDRSEIDLEDASPPPTRPLSDECRLGYPTACTGVANPTQAPRDRVACHGTAHVATF